ncbi:MAG: hypothetical protein GF364_11370 [Candidatus Lokiarchaeota archaeon]|nr:hypothetical protein [Candidatus Lokiarchaeota archaeon]
MMLKNIISVDLGTTEIKGVLINKEGIVDEARAQCKLQYKGSGRVEQDPDEIKQNIIKIIRKLVENNQDKRKNIIGITFTSNMQGILPVDNTGKPLMNLITWLDTRAAEVTKKIILKGWPKVSGIPLLKLLKFLRITGGAPGTDGKNTLAKTVWIKEEKIDIYNSTYKLLDTKDYGVFLATGKFITSIDMAYITWLMDTRENVMNWSQNLCDAFNLDINKFPQIKKSTENLGKITEKFANATLLPTNVEVINGSGDLLTSAIGSGAILNGQLHANIGTAGWVGCHYEERTLDIAHYSGTIASGIPSKYLILCKQETLGGALDWIRKIIFGDTESDGNSELSTKEQYKKIDEMVTKSPCGANQLIFTPWLHGERSPINDPYLRGQLFNIGMYHNRADILRAVYESVAFNLRWGIEVVEKQSKMPQTCVNIIGGASKSDTWCQIFADIWQKEVIRPKRPQMASALGAACIALIGFGIYQEFSEINKLIKIDKKFTPRKTHIDLYDQLYENFKNLYDRNKKLFYDINH